MKKLLVLFISLLLIFSINCFSLANEIAIRVGDETLTQHELDVRINKGASGSDPYKWLEPHEVALSFIYYALIKNTLEDVKPETDMDRIRKGARKRIDNLLEANNIGMGELEQRGNMTEQQIIEVSFSSLALEVLENYYQKKAEEFVTDQMIDEILYELNFKLRPKNRGEIAKKVRKTLIQIKKERLVRIRIFEEYEKGIMINTNQVDREKVKQAFNF
jgi:hypothetical protein